MCSRLDMSDKIDKLSKVCVAMARRAEMIADLKVENQREDLRPDAKSRNNSLIKLYGEEYDDLCNEAVTLKREIYGDENYD